MSTFSADWLRLREPLDARSRAANLLEPLQQAIGSSRRDRDRLQVVDLGAGTGANLRYSAPRLGRSQDWMLVERDPLLLGAMQSENAAWARACGARFDSTDGGFRIDGADFGCSARPERLDLAAELERLDFSGAPLVTASALLDLVSGDWLRRLVRRAASHGAPVWFALTYDGRIGCDPAEPEDERVRELFNAHQRTDKGFGPALGPAAPSRLEAALTESGYRTRSEPSDWKIAPDERGLQRALLDGWRDAALETDSGGDEGDAIDRWHRRRLGHLENGRSTIVVGHVDTLGWPAS